MKKILLFLIVSITTTANANNLCQMVSGASIVSQISKKYLGSITNKYDSNSIFNKYGNYGSEYYADSIMNDYGIYGGKYSAESPFNEYTSTPPYIVKNGHIIGYLTVNTYMNNALNPYVLIAECGG
ncbi:hypothetical protein [Wohlfahrtiimonas chitiniclastica]|uniref:hypothetical protein n=1 Tax=Wohlfahrtiimonas chitiniclastica TaxID=400946 RepID=UPI0007B69BE3|nr:hypothetical protein [Wohlfahrtiimonas chitiniclastica]KZX38234.1 hypothetical protein A6V30_04970 [Wohlfahrtiimonas chitiniclastica]